MNEVSVGWRSRRMKEWNARLFFFGAVQCDSFIDILASFLDHSNIIEIPPFSLLCSTLDWNDWAHIRALTMPCESGSFRDTCTQCEWSRHRISQIYLHRMRLGEFGEIVKQVWSHRRQTEFQLSWGSHIYRLCALCWIRKSLFKHKKY